MCTPCPSVCLSSVYSWPGRRGCTVLPILIQLSAEVIRRKSPNKRKFREDQPRNRNTLHTSANGFLSYLLSDFGHIRCDRSAHNAVQHQRVSWHSVQGRRHFSYRCKRNYIYACIVKQYDTLKVQNALADCLYYVMKNTICSCVKYVSCLTKQLIDIKYSVDEWVWSVVGMTLTERH